MITDDRPFFAYIPEIETLCVWSGVYGEHVGMLVHYLREEAEDPRQFDEEFSNRSTMVENECFLIEKPPFEFKNREQKFLWFVERCQKNYVNPVDEDDFDRDGVPDYLRQEAPKVLVHKTITFTAPPES